MSETVSKPDRDISIWEASGIAWDVLLTILVLTTLFAFGGIFADKHFGTRPLFTIIGFVLLAAVGYPIIKRKAQRIAKRMESSSPKPEIKP